MAAKRARTQSDPLASHDYRREAATIAYLDSVFQENKLASPLLRLPAELRLKIYEHVFAVPVIRTGDRSLVKPRWRYSRSQLSLLGVCRQIYFEARTLPFSVNVFRGWSGKVDRTIFAYMRKWQAYHITHIRLYIDKMDVFRDPHIELRTWFVMELLALCKLRRLKQLTLLWYDHRFEYVGQAICSLAWEVLEEVGRHDIYLTAEDCDPCKSYVKGPDTSELLWNYNLVCIEPLAPHLMGR